MRPVRVLLADDSGEFRSLLESLLRRLGFEIAASVASGELALAILTEAQPDVAILDLAMPGINGLETTKRIHQYRAEIRVIILTMHSTPEYRLAAEAAGVDAYVVKDELVPDLQNALRSLALAPGYAAWEVKP